MENRTLAIRSKGVPQNHRTIDRVTRILEEVVYNPGMTFAELVRALDAPKSSVHGFIRGLLASGWLYEAHHRFYLGRDCSARPPSGQCRYGEASVNVSTPCTSN